MRFKWRLRLINILCKLFNDVDIRLKALELQRGVISSKSWRRHQMETFSSLLAPFEGNPPIIGWFPSQRPVMQSFDVFFDLRLNKRLSKTSRCRWFETPLRPLCRHWNDGLYNAYVGHYASAEFNFTVERGSWHQKCKLANVCNGRNHGIMIIKMTIS